LVISVTHLPDPCKVSALAKEYCNIFRNQIFWNEKLYSYPAMSCCCSRLLSE
jgi:hypothetical protein